MTTSVMVVKSWTIQNSPIWFQNWENVGIAKGLTRKQNSTTKKFKFISELLSSCLTSGFKGHLLYEKILSFGRTLMGKTCLVYSGMPCLLDLFSVHLSIIIKYLNIEVIILREVTREGRKVLWNKAIKYPDVTKIKHWCEKKYP